METLVSKIMIAKVKSVLVAHWQENVDFPSKVFVWTRMNAAQINVLTESAQRKKVFILNECSIP